jgi:hypothetical protein
MKTIAYLRVCNPPQEKPTYHELSAKHIPDDAIALCTSSRKSNGPSWRNANCVQATFPP